MDAAKVGDRKFVKLEMTPEEYKNRHSIFISTYPPEDHWSFALKNQGYSLIGEYPVNETAILYQYELDETKRAQDSDPHLISVSIDSNQDIIEYCGVGAGFKRKKRNKNV